jgi:hypothetical protein
VQKVLILSDSIALPREKPEAVSYECTWPYLLRKHYDIHQVSIGGATIRDLFKQVNYQSVINPDVVILQCGIVDCAPRFMSRFEKDFYSRIPFLGSRLIKSLNNPNVRNFRRITYTPIRQFETHCDKIIKSFNGRSVFALGIIPASDEYDKILPGIVGNVNSYNKVLASSFGARFISLNDYPLEGVMLDFHHVNRLGHEFIYGKVMQVLKCND